MKDHYLNSVLIDGDVINDPVLIKDSENKSICTFFIDTKYVEKDVQMSVDVKIKCIGILADDCFKHMNNNSSVRVVGKIRREEILTDDNIPLSRLYILGDYIEFKPDFKSQKSVEI
jgi:hypothetical protein